MMESIKTIPLLDEEYIEINHASGLSLLLCSRPEYSSAFAQMTVRYGAVIEKYEDKSSGEIFDIPAGLAHFLEHKLFDNEDGSADADFSRLGANANAGTDYERTSYEFSTTDNFKENLEVLINMVTEPFFTDESVLSEQGIIGQEIDMYKDMASALSFSGLLSALYHKHPIRNDILGSRESIATITPEMLYRVHRDFYKLSNMVLVCSGNFLLSDVLEVCDRILLKSPEFTARAILPLEPKEVFKTLVKEKLDIALPLIEIGFKRAPLAQEDRHRMMAQLSIMLEIFFGDSSDLFIDLYEEGIISSSIDAGAFEEDGMFMIYISAESGEVDIFLNRFKEYAKTFMKKSIDEKVFNRIKKMFYAKTFMSAAPVEAIAAKLRRAFVEDTLPNKLALSISEVALRDLDELRKTLFDFSLMAVSIVEKQS